VVIGSALYYSRVFSQNLRTHLRLVFLDHRGFARPSGQVEPSEIALERVVEDVEQARQTLGLGRVVVIGHSGHAYMALEYAKKCPRNVSHVVLIGISPDLGVSNWVAAERHWQESAAPERKAALAANRNRLPDDALAKLSPRDRFVQGYVRDGPRAWHDFRFDSTPLWAGVDVNLPVINHLWGKEFRGIDITRGLAAFDRPVWLALGRDDFLVAPPSSWDPLRPKFRDLTVQVFERSGHTPPLEESEAFDAALLQWLMGHPDRGEHRAVKPTP
jgi:proline iminopeptidase